MMYFRMDLEITSETLFLYYKLSVLKYIFKYENIF